jgi:hypothetical protein
MLLRPIRHYFYNPINNPKLSLNAMSNRRIKVEELHKIDIHCTVTSGYWSRRIGDYKLCLSSELIGERYFLVLDVNTVRAPIRYLLSSRTIGGRLQRGGKIPWDKSEVWYVHGRNNKRYRFLYINPSTFEIGTRDDHGARYHYNCLSERQRLRYREYLDVKRRKRI